jgi:3-ketosteroid 9alpha-monooxygenase subunit B
MLVGPGERGSPLRLYCYHQVITVFPPMRTTGHDHDPVLREHGYHALRIKQIVQETDDASSFVLAVPDGLRETFRYQAGQFCTFRVRIDGCEHLRSYSMSSAPEIDGDLAVTVKRVPGGLVSNWLLDNLSEGDVLEVTKPAGVFCPQETERPVMAFCGGSGITPVMSITKGVLAGSQRSVKLLYANRHRRSVIFHDALAQLVARHPGALEVCLHLDSDSGLLSSEAIAGFAAGSLDSDVYICGPGPFMDLVESTLQGLGVERDRIFIERFLVDQQEKTDALVVGGDGAEAAATPDEVTVLLGRKKSVIRYQRGDTVLETARRGGLRPPFSCEAGNCATCMAFLKEGSVTMRANNALTPEEVEEGWILTCQSLPSSPRLVVEYESL